MIAATGRLASLALFLFLAGSSAAQTPLPPEMDESIFDKFLASALINEITLDAPYRVMVTFSRANPELRKRTEQRILCDEDSMAIQDLDLKHDDRYAVKPGTCDALLAAARRRKEAQERL
jgi:hypothetical protein